MIPRLAARLAGGLAVAIGPCPGPAGDGRGPCPEPDLHEPAAARRLPRRRGDGGRPVVRLRHRPRRPGGAPDLTSPGTLPPAWLRIGLRVIGLIGWLWIIGQGIAGGASDGEVATLFLWNYGWVGLAIICAIIGPAWHFLDPFSTIHDVGGLDPGAV